jgi:hypothetical protein
VSRAGSGITTAALDPCHGYAAALRTSLPHAVRVLDAFNVTRLGFAAVDLVRRRIQHEGFGHRGRKDEPLYRIRRLLRRAAAHHTERSWARMVAGSTPATPPTSSWPAPGSPPRICGRSTAAQTAPPPHKRCIGGWPNAPTPTSPS